MHNDDPCLILSHDMHKVGRGGSHNKTKVKNLRSGAITQVTFSGNETAEQAEVVNRNLQYMYSDGENASFMDPESFEQYEIKIENIPGESDFLKEGEKYQGVFFEGEVISLLIPKKMSLKVTSAPEGTKGDSANNPQKEVELETGLKINTPLFIKEGDVVFVNTENVEYGGRDNN